MIYVESIGTEIVLNMKENIEMATGRVIKYRKPNGLTGEWPAALEGTTKLFYKTLLVTDLDIAGIWLLQPHITTTLWQGFGNPVKLQIYPKI